jgi:hypothetical protein
VLSTAFYTFFVTGVMETLYFLFMIRELNLSAGWIGAILGAWVSPRVMKKRGPGPLLLWSTNIGNGALLLVPLATGPIWTVILMLAASQLIVDLFVQVYMVNQLTLQQSITPDHLQGRVIATMWSVALGLAPSAPSSPASSPKPSASAKSSSYPASSASSPPSSSCRCPPSGASRRCRSTRGRQRLMPKSIQPDLSSNRPAWIPPAVEEWNRTVHVHFGGTRWGRGISSARQIPRRPIRRTRIAIDRSTGACALPVSPQRPW